MACGPISIHALLAESDKIRYVAPDVSSISIHALLAESDRCKLGRDDRKINFYPRSPCGERPPPYKSMIHHEKISIHALLAESDRHAINLKPEAGNFYPRSPCGERLAISAVLELIPLFLSTLSLRRATNGAPSSYTVNIFLSTLSLRRATNPSKLAKTSLTDFYPRSPCGERLWVLRKVPILSIFLSTLSLRRATWALRKCFNASQFLSTLSLRRATFYIAQHT